MPARWAAGTPVTRDEAVTLDGDAPPRADGEEGHRRLVEQLGRLGAPKLEPRAEARLLELLADCLGVGLAGRATTVGEQVHSLFGSSPAPWDAALALGTRVHALDFDDTHEPSLCHTAAALVPALVSLAVERGCGGHALLRAYALGLRTVSFLSPLGPALNQKGVHSTGSLGGLASAAACAWLLTEDPERAADAMEIAALLVSGLGVAFGSDCKPLQAGHAAEVGVRAGLLAAARVSCPRNAPFGPRGLYRLWLGPGTPEPHWGASGEGAVFEVAVKPYPSCFLTHGTIDSILALRHQVAGASAIEHVQLAVNPMAATLADKTVLGAPHDAKFSLRYCALAALGDGRVTLDTFDAPAQARLTGGVDQWRSWSSRFEVRADPQVPMVAAELRIRTADGRTLEAKIGAQRGSPERPLSRPEIVEKFLANASPALGEAAAERLLAAIWDLPAAGDVSGCRELAAACGPGPLWSRRPDLATAG
jgi:2-methylcitrate dehydratase PrpD